jgi:hypothetical protein
MIKQGNDALVISTARDKLTPGFGSGTLSNKKSYKNCVVDQDSLNPDPAL